jgi:hypothetical protein
MSQIIAMSQKLQECEHIIEALKGKTSPLTDMNGPPSEHEHEPNRDDENPGSAVKISASLLSDLSLDENGKVCRLRWETYSNKIVNMAVALLLWTYISGTSPSSDGSL